jgi:hypothetical protein
MTQKISHGLAQILFLLAVLTGMALFGALTWADLEASFYFGYGLKGQTHLHLVCPYILTTDETGQVTAYVRNTTDRDLEPRLEVNLSGTLIRTERVQVQTAAGQTVPVRWPVGAGEVVFGHLIIVSVYQFQAFVLPSAAANCGVLYLNIHGLTGGQVLGIALGVSLAGMLAGLVLWSLANRPLKGLAFEQQRGMLFLAAAVALGLLFSLLGWWMASVLAFILSAFMVIILLTRYMLAPGLI